MTGIALSRMHFPVTTLGPGRRLGIWFQGCSIRCPGCISMDTWAVGRNEVSVDEIVAKSANWLQVADGITISGGEPFDQCDGLIELLRAFRARSPADVLVYSGYPIESLRGSLEEASGLIDALITDPFERSAPQTLPIRGSDNQRLHLLTQLGRARFSAYSAPDASRPPAFDLMFDEDGAIWLAGIPGREDFKRLRFLLEQAGHHVSMTLHDAPDGTEGSGT